MLKKLILSLALVAGTFVVSSCSLPRGAALQSEILREHNKEEPTVQVVQVTRDNIHQIQKWPVTGWDGQYHWIDHTRAPRTAVILPGDTINLTIWDVQDNSFLLAPGQKQTAMSNLTVASDGTVFVPYADKVVVKGMTSDEAREVIQSKLAEVAPSVQVQIVVNPGQTNSFDLVSGVPRPGTYPLPDRSYTILSAIAQGGGVATNLRNPLVRLVRGSKTYEIRSDRLFADARKNTTLRGNDRIIIEEDKRSFNALGAASQEKIIFFDSENVTAMEALSMMGGISDNRADPQGVLILREYKRSQVSSSKSTPDLQQVIFAFNLTRSEGLFAARKFQINPQDTVLITESPITAARSVISLFGALVGLGNATNSLSN